MSTVHTTPALKNFAKTIGWNVFVQFYICFRRFQVTDICWHLPNVYSPSFLDQVRDLTHTTVLTILYGHQGHSLIRFCRCRCKNFHTGPDALFCRPHRRKLSVIIHYFPKQGPVTTGAHGALHRLHLRFTFSGIFNFVVAMANFVICTCSCISQCSQSSNILK